MPNREISIDMPSDGYVSAMEWRFPRTAPGNAEPGFDTPGPGTAWARQRVPLVAGEADTPLTRAAFVGEADGRWLWVVVRPAAAALLMSDDWLLIDVTGMGPEALEMPFGGDRGEW